MPRPVEMLPSGGIQPLAPAVLSLHIESTPKTKRPGDFARPFAVCRFSFSSLAARLMWLATAFALMLLLLMFLRLGLMLLGLRLVLLLSLSLLIPRLRLSRVPAIGRLLLRMPAITRLLLGMSAIGGLCSGLRRVCVRRRRRGGASIRLIAETRRVALHRTLVRAALR